MSFSLIAMRNGERLHATHALTIHYNQAFGRAELLMNIWTACGCADGSCADCTATTSWARTKLSRSCVKLCDNGNFWVRSHAAHQVAMNGSLIASVSCQQDGEWIGPMQLQHNDCIRFQSKTPGLLFEFKVVMKQQRLSLCPVLGGTIHFNHAIVAASEASSTNNSTTETSTAMSTIGRIELVRAHWNAGVRHLAPGVKQMSRHCIQFRGSNLFLLGRMAHQTMINQEPCGVAETSRGNEHTWHGPFPLNQGDHVSFPYGLDFVVCHVPDDSRTQATQATMPELDIIDDIELNEPAGVLKCKLPTHMLGFEDSNKDAVGNEPAVNMNAEPKRNTTTNATGYDSDIADDALKERVANLPPDETATKTVAHEEMIPDDVLKERVLNLPLDETATAMMGCEETAAGCSPSGSHFSDNVLIVSADALVDAMTRPSRQTKKRRLLSAGAKVDSIVQPVNKKQEQATRVQPSNYRLFFVPKGSDMSREHLEGSSSLGEGLKQRARNRGALVLEAFDRTKPPNYLVVSALLSSMQSVLEAVGFCDQEELEVFLGEHNIVCVKRSWAAAGSKNLYPPFQAPKPNEVLIGIVPRKLPRSVELCALAQSERESTQDSTAVTFPVNEELSKLFVKLSKLYQQGPLLTDGKWTAYTFHLVSGRLQRLGFEITIDIPTLRRLSQVRGISSSCLSIIKEFLTFQTCTRLVELKSNPERLAMKTFVNIWGVGPVKARDLVTRGFTTIDQFRKAVFEDETEKLDRNQLVGLVCYEDINEDMDRTEAEMIFQVVSRAVKDRIPQAELSLMGSYRRGKTELGDVDILITSLYPHYRNYVSGKLLGQVVDSLCDSGHIAYHLTFLGGMDPCRFETLPASYAKYTYNPHDFGTQHAKNDGPRKSQTYMGVFYSPVRRGKRCRVDIKFYPHRERVYATLYFTGSAYFNRSMRLWTLKKKGWNLNDHGLFDGEKSKIRVMDGEKEFEANCEKDVFEILELVERQPHQRTCFDAVKGRTIR